MLIHGDKLVKWVFFIMKTHVQNLLSLHGTRPERAFGGALNPPLNSFTSSYFTTIYASDTKSWSPMAAISNCHNTIALIVA